ncbi:MAG: DoxX family membrane protein, partial [Planctomycetaceae bacterium]|nr:DoxX family membrane protein [Planctomycetaceae bacterium]
KQLSVAEPITPGDEAKLLSLVDVTRLENGQYAKRTDSEAEPDAADLEFYKTIEKLARQSRELSYRHKLAGLLKGNPEFVGVTAEIRDQGGFDAVMGTKVASDDDENRSVLTYGKIQEYKDLLADYERSLQQAQVDYQYDHATMLGRKVAIMRNELVSPVKELDASLKDAAQKMLTTEQLRRGSLPPENTPLYQADMRVMWGLLILGTLLIIGLFTRVAALLGALMVFSFYLVIPPLPGVPPGPGPEHSLIINKNSIEVVALLAIAALPTGSWFGIDGLFYSLIAGKKKKESPVEAPSKT